MSDNTSQSNLFGTRFSDRFLDYHAGKIIADPKIAIVELVANSWDAGSTEVQITWPVFPEKDFEITDNGTGMTRSEFQDIWTTLNYNRLKGQGSTTKVPASNKKVLRKVYGRNGKGRHSLFCFSDKYKVQTWKNGYKSSFNVIQSSGENAYLVEFLGEEPYQGHGTRISCNFNKASYENNLLKIDEVTELIGSKFIVDPSDFKVYINGCKINLVDLLEQSQEYKCEIPDEGTVTIFVIDSKTVGRTTKQHGVAWWVNNRLVGDHSWKDFKDSYLDGRTNTAKRYTIIVKADILEDEVTEDWTDFKDNDKVKRIKEYVKDFILETIENLMFDVRKEAKIKVLESQRATLKQMDPSSRQAIGSFINQVQKRCPTIKPQHLENIVDILAKMEASKSVYKLLRQLSQLSSDDMDSLSSILDEWDIMDAKIVLDELKKRLELIKEMESLVENPKADELHELQPLFEHGLWIFGPEYESIEFLSNSSLAKVIKTCFKNGNVETLENSRKRPDFVALTDGSLGVYSSNRYDGNSGEVCGTQKILIVELKRGGSIICDKNRHQAEYYAKEIKKSGKIEKDTKIVCYVLGTSVDPECEVSKIGDNIEVIPRSYSLVLRQAHARTFNLMKNIREAKRIEDFEDEEVREVLKQKETTDFPGIFSETA